MKTKGREQSSNIEDRREWAGRDVTDLGMKGRAAWARPTQPDLAYASDSEVERYIDETLAYKAEQRVIVKQDAAIIVNDMLDEVYNVAGSSRSTVAAQFGGLSPDDRQAVNDARDLETLTYTILGEARGEGVRGMVAVANVIRNRATSGIYSPDPVEVVLQPWQFSTHNSPAKGGNQKKTREEVPIGSPLYLQAQEIAKRYVLEDGIDLTGGSLFYHTAGTDWAYADDVRGPYGTTRIGRHVFYPQHPVPQVDIGDTDLLAGYHEPAPVPLPRSMRPAAPRIVTADTITAMQREVAIATTAQSLARARAAIVAEDATARLDANGNVVNPAPGAEGVGYSRGFDSYMLDDAAGEFVDRKTASILAGGSPEVQMAGGFGSLLGEAFPMVPPEVEIIAGIPTQVRGPSAPGVGLTDAQRQAMRAVLPPSSLRVAETPAEVDEGALTTRVVRTVAIDPRTGSPILTETTAGTSAPVQVTPVGQVSSRGAVGAAMREGRAPAFVSEDHPRSNVGVPFVSEDHERSNAVRYPNDRLSPLHNVNDPSEQISSRGRVGAAMRNAQPPVPQPASYRPPSLADRVVPLTFPPLKSTTPLKSAPVGHGKPQPIGNPPNVSSSSGGSSSSSISRPTQTTNPAMRNAISALPSSPGSTRGNSTLVVRKDGTVVSVPRAGDAQMPGNVTPNVPRIIPPQPTAAPTGHGAPKPKAASKPAAAVVKPQAPQFTTKTVKETIMVPNPEWGKVNPAAVSKLQDIHDKEDARIMAAQGLPATNPPIPKMIPKVIEKTIKVPVEAPAPAPVIEEAPAPAPRPRRVTPRAVVQPKPAPPPTFVGSRSGRTYAVGGYYSSAGVVYRATEKGTFAKVGVESRYAGMSPGQRYDAVNANAKAAAQAGGKYSSDSSHSDWFNEVTGRSSGGGGGSASGGSLGAS